MEKNKVIVKIQNKEYTIRSADSQDYIISVANELDTRINEIATENTKLNSEKLVILASLNLCDEYIKLKEENEILKQQVQDGKQLTLPEWDENDELEQAKAQIKLLESRLSDDIISKKETEDLKLKLAETEKDKKVIIDEYKNKIEELKKQFADKENEWLEMIENM